MRILILDDDGNFATGLGEGLKKSGFEVTVTTKPADAEIAILKGNIDYVLIDCLLPQLSGLEFVSKLKEMAPDLISKYILISGIFTDKNYIQEAIKETQAIAFLKKPFDIEEAIKLLRPVEKVRIKAETARQLLYGLCLRSHVSSKDKRRVLESIDDIIGFDLPFIYNLLMDTKASGYLNLYWENKVVSGVTFSKGCIVGVDIEDNQTRLGTMLIQSGYCLAEDVEHILQSADGRKRLGNRLISNNRLSPHGFDEVLRQQMNVRLAHTIVNARLKVNFASSDVELTSPHIDPESLTIFIHDWIASKVSTSWLKRQFILFLNNKLQKTGSLSDRSFVNSSQLISNQKDFISKFENGTTLSYLLAQEGYEASNVYKAVYFLLIKGLIYIGDDEIDVGNSKIQDLTLKRLEKDLANKTNSEISEYLLFGSLVSDSAETFKLFSKMMGSAPDEGSRADSYTLWNTLKNNAEEALIAKSGGISRNKMVGKDKIDPGLNLKCQAMIEQAKAQLQLNQYIQAKRILDDVEKISTDLHNFHILCAWAKLGIISNNTKKFTLHDVDMHLMQIPPDEKYEAVFPFVEGLYKKASGDLLGAKKSFERAVALDPSFIVARREISLLEQSVRKKQDVFNMDLKDVVNGLFNRKK